MRASGSEGHRLLQEFDAGHRRHALVDDEERDLVVALLQLAEGAQRFLGGARLDDAILAAVLLPQVAVDRVEHCHVIVDADDVGTGQWDLPLWFRLALAVVAGALQRQTDAEAGVSGLALKADRCRRRGSVTIRRATSRPMPVPLPTSFVVKKGSKIAVLQLGRDARPVVGDFDDHVRRRRAMCVIVITPSRPTASMALSMRFVQTWFISPAGTVIPRQRPVVDALDLDALLQLVAKDAQRVFDAVMDVDLLLRSAVHVGVFLHRAHQLGDAAGADDDRLEHLRHRQRAAEPAEDVRQQRLRDARSSVVRLVSSKPALTSSSAISQASSRPWSCSQFETSSSRSERCSAVSVTDPRRLALGGSVLEAGPLLLGEAVAVQLRRALDQLLPGVAGEVARALRCCRRVVQLVREAGGELAERRHLLHRADQPLLLQLRVALLQLLGLDAAPRCRGRRSAWR